MARSVLSTGTKSTVLSLSSSLSLPFCLNALLTIGESGLLLIWWTTPLSGLRMLVLHISVFLCWACVFMAVIVNWLLNHDEMPSLLTMLAWEQLSRWGQGHPCSPLVLVHTDALLHLFPSSWRCILIKQTSCTRGTVRLLGHWFDLCLFDTCSHSAILSLEWWGILPHLHVEYWWRRAHTAFMAHTTSWACGSFVYILLCAQLLFVGVLDWDAVIIFSFLFRLTSWYHTAIQSHRRKCTF